MDQVLLDEDDDMDVVEGIQPLQPDWEKPPTVAELKQDYTDASSDQQIHIQNIDKWLENLNADRAVKPKKVKNRSNIQPKTIRKQAEWRYAALTEPFLSTDDVFNVEPITHEDKEAAEQNALVLNNQFNTKLNKVHFFDEFIRTNVNEGTAIVRVGWAYEEKVEEVEVEDFQYIPSQNPQLMQQYQQMAQEMQADPITFQQLVHPEVQKALQISMQSGMPTEAVLVGSHMEDQVTVVKNHPTIEVCNYNNVSVDPLCKGIIEDADFVIYAFETSKSALEKDGKYSNLAHINVNASSILGAEDNSVAESSSFNFTDEPRKKFWAYEYWGNRDIDGSGKTTAIVATWVGDVLIRLEENPFPDQAHPFVATQYLPVKKSVYGEPDGALLEDNQKIIGAVTRGMIDILGRSANGQTGMSKDLLDVTNRRKYDEGKDYEYNPGSDPRQAIHMHVFPEIPNSASLMLGVQQAEAESLTGVRPFNSGMGGANLDQSATATRGALDAASKRELGIIRRLAEGVKQIGRKIISMNSEFLSDEEVIRITNDEFVSVRRDDLAGNFDLNLTISTAEADDNKASELAFMLQTTAQSMGSAFSQIILGEIATLRKMPALARKIEEYKPEPDPVEEEKRMLEVELLKAQIQNELAKASENNANAVLDQAKAGHVTSQKDAADLDFLEQEKGIKHNRDVDKITAQANANTEMKVIDNFTKAKFAPKKESTSKA